MKSIRKCFLFFLLMLVTFLSVYQPVFVQGENGPIIQIDPITHTFAAVFEGQPLSHDFTVINRGSADLEIQDVTHQ